MLKRSFIERIGAAAFAAAAASARGGIGHCTTSLLSFLVPPSQPQPQSGCRRRYRERHINTQGLYQSVSDKNGENNLASNSYMYHSSSHRLILEAVMPREVAYKPLIKRILCVSDIHTDYDDNFRWTKRITADPNALLIVSGDISHKMSVIRPTLEILAEKFGAVAFTPGNHDLWVDADREGAGGLNEGIRDSVEKLAALLKLCDELGVETGPLRVGGDKGLWVVPLLSWHHQSFDTEPDIDTKAWGRIPSVERLVADYRRARWPEPLSQRDESVAKFVDELNDHIIQSSSYDLIGSDSSPVLTFSHFLPRIELTPEKRYMTFPTLNKAVGSDYVETRIRRLGSSFHVYGHTHFGWDQTIDDIRYVQASLAYPREWDFRARSLMIGTMTEEHDFQPVCVWDEASHREGGEDGFPPLLAAYWSDRFYHIDRKPEIVDALPPWNANRFKKLAEGRVEDYVRHNSTRFLNLWRTI